MSSQILAKSSSPSQFLTTGDVAQMLGITVHGVRWLARHGRLPYQATASGQRMFQTREVVQVLEQRAKTRLTGVPVARVIGEPRQLSLFGKARLQIVAG